MTVQGILETRHKTKPMTRNNSLLSGRDNLWPLPSFIFLESFITLITTLKFKIILPLSREVFNYYQLEFHKTNSKYLPKY